jgi:hypothetical protein
MQIQKIITIKIQFWPLFPRDSSFEDSHKLNLRLDAFLWPNTLRVLQVVEWKNKQENMKSCKEFVKIWVRLNSREI